MKKLLLGCCAAILSLSAGVSANAATIVDATRIRLTTAGGVVLQVGELVALDFSTVPVDVAAASNGATATTNQIYSDVNGGPNTGPGNAIDGVTPYFRGYGDSPTFYHAINTAGYLDVTFDGPKTLSSLSIYGRTDCCSERDIYNVAIYSSGANPIFTTQLDATGSTHSATITFDRPETGAVPEPATWALMIGGFGMAGAALRSRRSVAAA